MKKLMTLMIAGSALLVACTSAPDADKVAAADAQEVNATGGNTVAVDVAGSNVGWIASKATGQHNGTFNLTEGSLNVEDGKLIGGSFNIDIASITVLDLEGEDKGKLEGHLKSGDFFETEKFPSAKFEITGVEEYNAEKMESKLAGASHIISGNLTLRDVTKNVSFPAVVNVDGNSVSAKADFNIDRTEWGMNYKGPNNPADWFISKEVNLKLDVTANGGSLSGL